MGKKKVRGSIHDEGRKWYSFREGKEVVERGNVGTEGKDDANVR